jgi:hypothetical protein
MDAPPTSACSAAAPTVRMSRCCGWRSGAPWLPLHLPVLVQAYADQLELHPAAAGVSKQVMGYLDRRGYVSKRRHPSDGRALAVSRTDRGWGVTRLARDVVQETQRDWAQLLGEQELTAVLAALRELVGRMGYSYTGSVAGPAILGMAACGRRRAPISPRPQATNRECSPPLSSASSSSQLRISALKWLGPCSAAKAQTGSSRKLGR